MKLGTKWAKAGMMAMGILLVAGSAWAADTIKIGVMVPLTGPAAADGQSAQQSVEMAVAKVNAAGGINSMKVEALFYDDQFDPKQAVTVARRMIEADKVMAGVSGSYSGPTRAAAQVFEENKVPFSVGYALHPDVTKDKKYVFRLTVLGPIQGRAAGYAAGKLMNVKTVSLLVLDNDFGVSLAQGFKEYAEKFGVKILSEDKFKMGEKEYSPVLTKIKGLNPDALFTTAYPLEGALMIKQAGDLGLKIKMIGTEGLDSTKGFLDVAGRQAEGLVITTNLDRDSKVPEVQEYLQGYEKKYGFAPDMTGASTYDAFMAVLEAIKKGGDKPEKVVEAFRTLRGWQGVTGKIDEFTAGGEVIKDVVLQVVKDGKFRYYGVVSDRTLLTP